MSDDLADRLTRRSLALNPGCCGDDRWRGHLCQYHDGFYDGVEAALQEILGDQP